MQKISLFILLSTIVGCSGNQEQRISKLVELQQTPITGFSTTDRATSKSQEQKKFFLTARQISINNENFDEHIIRKMSNKTSNKIDPNTTDNLKKDLAKTKECQNVDFSKGTTKQNQKIEVSSRDQSFYIFKNHK